MSSKIYFFSDAHLGIDTSFTSRERERIIVSWLESIRIDASELFIVGDLFDFWFEYKKVVPKGYVRLLGKLAELVDQGIVIHYFTGNHDMWMFDYLNEEMNIQIHKKPKIFERHSKKLLIGHGDGLGPGDFGYKFIKKIFASKICQWLYAKIHPNLGIVFASFLSGRSRYAQKSIKSFSGEQEWLVQYCRSELEKEELDYFIFGHRHLACDYLLNESSRYINIGEWMFKFHYAVLEKGDLHLKQLSESEIEFVLQKKA